MTTVPNQDVVTVNKEACNKDNLYATINIRAIQLAMKDLSNAEFQVWLYFAKNQAGYTFAVSPADALNEFGISKDTFKKSKAKLKEKGYLVEDLSKGPNHWIFYEIPKEDIMYVEKK